MTATTHSMQTHEKKVNHELFFHLMLIHSLSVYEKVYWKKLNFEALTNYKLWSKQILRYFNSNIFLYYQLKYFIFCELP